MQSLFEEEFSRGSQSALLGALTEPRLTVPAVNGTSAVPLKTPTAWWFQRENHGKKPLEMEASEWDHQRTITDGFSKAIELMICGNPG